MILARIIRTALCGAALLAISMPAAASVREGVDAWSAGEFETAVSLWEGPAQAGDPDALFNLGQAYRLGRGVARDMNRAEELYRRASEAGHLRAADTYGLLLFQSGEQQDALPYIVSAAGRGDPRAQYLLGIAYFNGGLVERDWQMAYALMSLANGEGLPQAAAAISTMDQHIPLAQRQEAAELAIRLKAEADERHNLQLASADLGVDDASQSVRPAQAASAPVNRDIPRQIETAPVPPVIVAASSAIRDAREADGTASPADAGASFGSRGPAAQAAVQVAQARPARPAAPVSARPAAPAPAPAAAATGGAWRVQLGAFGVEANADRLWTRLSSRAELSGSTKLLIPAGRVTKLQAGGFASRSAAQKACSALKASGTECLVTR